MAEHRFRRFGRPQTSNDDPGAPSQDRPALPAGNRQAGGGEDAGAVERVRGGTVPAHSGLTEERKQAYAQKGQGASVPRFGRLTTVNADFLLDATGSMEDLIGDAKAAVGKIVTHVNGEVQATVQFRFVAYRDYGDGADIIQASERSEDPGYLAEWLEGVKAEGGQDIPEAIEHALLEVLRQNPPPDVVLLAGDAPSHTKEQLRVERRAQTTKTAVEIAQDFRAADIPIYTFVVRQKVQIPQAREIETQTIQDFQAIAQTSGGVSGVLDGSDAMLEMATMAILHRVGGKVAVDRFAERRALSPGARNFQARLGPGRQQ